VFTITIPLDDAGDVEEAVLMDDDDEINN